MNDFPDIAFEDDHVRAAVAAGMKAFLNDEGATANPHRPGEDPRRCPRRAWRWGWEGAWAVLNGRERLS